MAGSMCTSFVRHDRKDGKTLSTEITGARNSLHNNQILISTGVPSLDYILGGGVPLGTIFLVEEDYYGNTAKVLLKYFLAEGIVSKHSLLLASASIQPSKILKQLPSLIKQENKVPENNDSPSNLEAQNDPDLKIAWRYRELPQVKSFPGINRYDHYYDLSKPVSHEDLEKADVETFDAVACEDAENCGFLVDPIYEKLLFRINNKIREEQFNPSSAFSNKNVLRIAIHSLGSLLWDKHNVKLTAGSKLVSITRFLHVLRSLLRHAHATCFVSVPTHIFQDAAILGRIRNLSDTIVSLESFEGSDKETNALFKDYHGLFHIKRLPRLNSLTCHMPETMNFVYKLKKRKFLIEKLHLPPDLQEDVSRPQEDPVPDKRKHLAVGCGAARGSGSKLDF